jgi:hypothetical protein
MARPKKDGMDYFPHDTDAVNDEKIEALRMLYGNDGYAFYFILLERIYRTANFELDVSDAETIQILSRKVGVNEEVFEKILKTSLKRGCFDKVLYEERRVLTSSGIKKRATVVVEKRVKMRDKYSVDKDKVVSDAETPQETREETPQSKVKESKEKESKEKEISNSPKRVYDESSLYYQLSTYFFERILENNPEHKKPNLQTWSEDIRKMMEIDKRTEEQIKYLMKWVQEDDFEKVNVLSPTKIRKRFDNLIMKVKQQRNKKPKSIFDQGEASKERQAAIKPPTAEEEEQIRKWEEELPY